MSARARIGFALAFAACLAGCATEFSASPSAVVTSPRVKVLSADRMKDAVAVGKSTKADVIAALGETLVISFETGYEVWVYRLTTPKSGEFVVLFAPSGVATKTRVRAPQPL